MNNVLIAPSILAADFRCLDEQVKAVHEAGVQWIHLDIMDGHFVPNISFGPPVVSSIRKGTNLVLDTHLMIDDPNRYLEAFREAGSDIITVHQEVCPHLHRTVSRIRELGAKAGVALNPATSVSQIKDILDDVDLILIMTVNPGFGGQKFIQRTVDKIRECRQLIASSGRSIYLEVDGGIDTVTAPVAVTAGADVLVAGTSVFGVPDLRKAVKDLMESVSPRHTP
ncbi:MAG: ribulose-phosphate 3-epimerase [Ignavibacteriales bacterium]|nr:ribulose-phosphate 3-epimerase [Ignavibacteriales bacterium]